MYKIFFIIIKLLSILFMYIYVITTPPFFWISLQKEFSLRWNPWQIQWQW